MFFIKYYLRKDRRRKMVWIQPVNPSYERRERYLAKNWCVTLSTEGRITRSFQRNVPSTVNLVTLIVYTSTLPVITPRDQNSKGNPLSRFQTSKQHWMEGINNGNPHSIPIWLLVFKPKEKLLPTTSSIANPRHHALNILSGTPQLCLIHKGRLGSSATNSTQEDFRCPTRDLPSIYPLLCAFMSNYGA
jgi:hypothetical protein